MVSLETMEAVNCRMEMGYNHGNLHRKCTQRKAYIAGERLET